MTKNRVLTQLFNSLEAAKKNRNIHFIYLSSSMVYGNFKKTTVNENDECNPLGIYGALKFSAEKIKLKFRLEYLNKFFCKLIFPFERLQVM